MLAISRVPYVNHWLVLLGDLAISMFATMLSVTTLEGLLSSSFSPYRIFLILSSSFVASLMSFLLLKTHKNIIRHSTLQSLWRIILACLTKALIMLLFFLILKFQLSHTQLWLELGTDILLTLFLLVVFRVGLISAYQLITRNIHSSKHKILLFGNISNRPDLASLLNLNFRSSYQIAGYVSFGDSTRTYQIGNLPSYHVKNLNELNKLVKKEDLEGFIFSTQHDLLVERDHLVAFSIRHHLRLFTVPPMDRWKHSSTVNAREVSIEDLLGRDEIQISVDLIKENLSGKTVLITGAAGSIGSELCRQISHIGVGKLILLDSCETGMHNLRLELEDSFANLDFVPVIGDVRSVSRLEFVFKKHRPQVVFHAAAYKHVPLMEANPCEAIRANTIGTRNVADMAVKYGASKFIMISTDKAVNPTNVMGASKRLAEIYVQSLNQAVASGQVAGSTIFITTRFGNVLGSQGSVIPRFKEQIEKGGPITVTHPQITRYFMTIREACLLVLEASIVGKGGDVMVFDMGSPVKIVDLAKRMITLAGYSPGEDIDIEFVGLRPGEKLYEELLNKAEETLPTPHEKIRIASVREYPYSKIKESITQIGELALKVDIEETIRMAKQIVPEYVSNNSEFEKLDK